MPIKIMKRRKWEPKGFPFFFGDFMTIVLGISSVLIILAPMVLILGFLIFILAEVSHSAWIHFAWTPPKNQPNGHFDWPDI